MRKGSNAGFTLIEVLVALVIFSLMAVGFSRYVDERAKQTVYLADKTLAAVIASNTLTETRTNGAWPQSGRYAQQVSMADKQWQVTTLVRDTEHPGLRQLEVSVSLPENAQPLVTFTGFVESIDGPPYKT